MAAWAWPDIPASNWAKIRLVGGPFDGEEAGYLPPDIAAPVQVVWSGWSPQGFTAWLYEWHGEATTDRGRTDALIYRPSGRRLGPEEIPPLIAEVAEVWADGAEMIQRVYDVSPELLFPGI